MALQEPYQWDFVTPGLPDGVFEAAPGFSPTPMELRVILLAYLRPRPDSVVWDVGGGTGALALEIARLLPGGRVQALERDPEALELLERNRARFGIQNLEVFAGQAPADLAKLAPAPDRVLLGGGSSLRRCAQGRLGCHGSSRPAGDQHHQLGGLGGCHRPPGPIGGQ